MSVPDVSRLTDKQKECLRLVAQNLNTKQIARRIGKSDHAVDQRIRQALRALGVADRFEAARILAEAEGRQTYQPLIYQTDGLAPAPEMAISGGQEASAADPMPPHGKTPRFPPLGGRDNDLDAVQRIKLILSLALMIGGTIAALVAAGLWVMSFFSEGA
ncbi:helix-turn-helix transcriptional regulator [Sphingobium sp. LB126]|uniref:response regulator transcription factor n=1 Tax=Sphingobium sp. LB126 TaxID=1983755 RepID=UPI0012FE4018|nr:helix-turn-helix transcriptional regulator [Sphingobium sp. LB126]